MSVTEDDGIAQPDLEFDMWEGQFEFLGGQFTNGVHNNNNNNNEGEEQVPMNGNFVYDRTADLFPCKTQINGLKKSKARRWCEDLTEHVQMLQQQMNVLADNQTHSDERYTRAKQDNAALQARIVMLEEQLREVELRSEEKLAEEERRHRELVARVDREKQLQVENCAIRLQTLELENNSLRDETGRWRNQLEKMRLDKSRVEDQLIEAEASVTSLRDEIAAVREQERKLREQAAASQILVEELSSEVERLQSEKANAEMLAELNRIPSSEPSPLQAQLEALRHQHKTLQEAHEELQALVITKSVEEGRHLLTNAGPNSLAAELQFEAMSQDAMRTALKEAQEVNTQLRSYIDGILLLIVDNCPRLLEIKTPPPPPAH